MSDFIPIYPFYAIMFTEMGQLSVPEVSILFIIWFGTSFLSEIPTGVIADKISRRDSVILGNVFTMSTMACWLLFPTFLGYALGFFLWGVGYALISGANESYIYEMLKKLGSQENFGKIYARTTSIGWFGMFIAYVIASIGVFWGYNLLLVLSIISLGVSIAILFLLPRDNVTQHVQSLKFMTILRDGFAIISQNPQVITLVILFAGAGGFIGMMEEYVPLYYKWKDVPEYIIPHILTFGILTTSAVTWVAHRYEHTRNIHLTIILIIIGLLLFVTSFFGTIIAVLGIFLYLKYLSFLEIIFKTKIHNSIDTHARATVGSLASFCAQFIAFACLSTYAAIAFFNPPVLSVGLIGLVVCILAIATTSYLIKTKTTN